MRRTGESDGNGWFGFAGLPPGTYHVRAVWPGGADGKDNVYEADMRVHPGETARTVALPAGLPLTPEVAGVGDQPEGAKVLLDAPLVTSGSDRLGDHFFVADGLGQTPLRVDAPRLVPPTIMGDRVLVAGTLHHTPDGVVLEADAVRVVGTEIVKAE